MGDVIEVRYRGSRCNVLIMDEGNFNRYERGDEFEFVGREFFRSPASVAAPGEGRWHVIIVHPDGERGIEKVGII